MFGSRYSAPACPRIAYYLSRREHDFMQASLRIVTRTNIAASSTVFLISYLIRFDDA
jgi:hypothetical protein